MCSMTARTPDAGTPATPVAVTSSSPGLQLARPAGGRGRVDQAGRGQRHELAGLGLGRRGTGVHARREAERRQCDHDEAEGEPAMPASHSVTRARRIGRHELDPSTGYRPNGAVSLIDHAPGGL